jgi:hypothetical protein
VVFHEQQLDPIAAAPLKIHALVRARPVPLPTRVTADDGDAHRALVRTLGSEAVWLDYLFRSLRNSATHIPQATRMLITTASKYNVDIC